jgi:hypothetical protein
MAKTWLVLIARFLLEVVSALIHNNNFYHKKQNHLLSKIVKNIFFLAIGKPQSQF